MSDAQQQRWSALQQSCEQLREDYACIAESLALATQRLHAMQTTLRHLEAEIRGIEYNHWRDDDSPKGETVPGVRHGDPVSSITPC